MAETEVRAEPATPPHRIEIEEADEYSRYLLHSRTEILAVLRTLIAEGCADYRALRSRQVFSADFNAARPDGRSRRLHPRLGRRPGNESKGGLAKADPAAVVDKVKISSASTALTLTQYDARHF